MAIFNGTTAGDTLFIQKDATGDTLNGLAGNDLLVALTGAGGNTLNGGDGDDNLFGYQNDTLTGGAGFDLFELTGVKLPNAPNLITDFNVLEDGIQVDLAPGGKTSDIKAQQVGSDILISFGTTQLAIVKNTLISTFTANSLYVETNPFIPILPLIDFKKDPAKYMASIRDYDGNNLGGTSSWKSLGDADIQGDGDLESILVNPAIGRFASVGSVNGNVDFSRYGLNGDTRVVGIYSDPTLINQPLNVGGPFDSQKRFQDDLRKDNLKLLAASDYNKDGFQDLYFKLGDNSAVLRASMFKDGNIQYANYQSKADLTKFMNDNNVSSSVWGGWI
jgi:RTX calcium-binding nonapeptide repeat (4 copies)